MKCCICGHSVGQWGNDPYPLCSANDYESRCCDLCNNMVIKARIINSTKDNDNIQIGDTIMIFYSKNSDAPTKVIADQSKFLIGTIESILESDDQKSKKYEGTWGSFTVDSKTDSFTKID